MAQRDLSTTRTVIGKAIENPSGTVQAVSQLATQIITQGQEAKINENLSKGQLALSALDNQFRIDNQSDPFNREATTKYKEDRKNLFNNAGEGISSSFKRQWESGVAELTGRSDIASQAWGFKQSRVNMVNSVNESIKTDFLLATESGRTFADDDIVDFEALLNFAPAKERLSDFASRNLGEETTDELLRTYNEDYVKSFISGAAENNPVKALQLLEDEGVKEVIVNGYAPFKKAIENRALNMTSIESNQLILNKMRDSNDILSKSSLTNPIPYSELQQRFDKGDVSKEQRDFFSKANGYATTSAPLSLSEKEEMKVDVYDVVMSLATSDNITSSSVETLQNTIYNAMDKGAFTRKEGTDLINSLLSPIIEKKEASLSAFEDSNWYWPDSLGFDDVQDYYKDNVEIKAPDGEDEVGAISQRVNNNRKLALYSNYTSALERAASTKGISMLDLQDLNKEEKMKVYSDAAKTAIDLFAKDSFPGIRTLSDTPNDVLTNDGRVIKLKDEPADIPPDFTVDDIKTQIEFDPQGRRARITYKDGVRVKADILAEDDTVLRSVTFSADGGIN